MNLWEKKIQDGQKPDNSATKTAQIRTESNDKTGAGICPDDNSNTLPEHLSDTSLHKKCALCVHQNFLLITPELELIIKSWQDLPDEVKQKIMELIPRKEKGK